MTLAETPRQRRPDRVMGEPHATFWEGCGRGELRLQHCAACGGWTWPAAAACEACGATALTWRAVSGEGRVVSWCTFEKDYYRGALPLPWTNIVVELAEGVWFLSEPDGFGPDDIAIDMAVRVAFLPCEDSHGPFALPVFRRAGAAVS